MKPFSSRNGASAQPSRDGDDNSRAGTLVPAERYSAVFNLVALLHGNPVHHLAIEAFERNHLEIMRLSLQPDIDLRGVARLMGMASEQMLQTFVAASAAANGYKNHAKYSHFYSVELELAQERYDYLSDDYRYNKGKLLSVEQQLKVMGEKIQDLEYELEIKDKKILAFEHQLEVMEERFREVERKASNNKQRMDSLFQWAQQNGMVFPVHKSKKQNNRTMDQQAAFQNMKQRVAEIQKGIDAITHTLGELEMKKQNVDPKHPLKPFNLKYLATQLPSIAPQSVILNRGYIHEVANSICYPVCMYIADEDGLRKKDYFTTATYIIAALLDSMRDHRGLMIESKGNEKKQARINYVLRAHMFEVQAKVHEAIQQAFGEPGKEGTADVDGKRFVYALAAEVAPYATKILG
ncbi:hypothetical protein CkaCkLH20_04414 [Colletotrichum karsti]|uniref:Uncharacterized protein n=1 Tax=Colletotrichum karsti TaxID=1095194 RepID=A0A9P6I5U3_9PEZI|nr:uncharacterized protein CkaCkLH20_04414 [Colletotrichum karsti]KAF9877838.1 hypothetical protein CkaCkLH20_04414 [Colletotrichum karsti]